MEPPILVVDDNPGILAMIEMVLEAEGLQPVLTFGDPVAALKTAVNMEVRPRLVITDFSMPRLNGLQLLDAIAQVHPDLSGVIITAEPRDIQQMTIDYPILDKNAPDLLPSLVRIAREL